MILWALSDVARGTPVLFIGSTKEEAAALVYVARDYARQIGLDPNMILRPAPQGFLFPSQWPKGVKVYQDHQLTYGAPVHEPQEMTSNGQDAAPRVLCPWCGQTRTWQLAFDRFCEGLERNYICSSCGRPVLIRVQRVRVTIQAWRGNDEDQGRS